MTKRARATTPEQRAALYADRELRARTPQEDADYRAMLAAQADEYAARSTKLLQTYREDARRWIVDLASGGAGVTHPACTPLLDLTAPTIDHVRYRTEHLFDRDEGDE